MGEFRTIKGYDIVEGRSLTPAMEDYLEMICRLSKSSETSCVRMQELANALNVKASSASKMADMLKIAGYIHYEKYAELRPTNMGKRIGEYLLHRHEVVHRFLCLLNNTKDELEQVEKIEHFLEQRTVENLEALVEKLSAKTGE